jgi:hypothetical protein
MMAIARRGEQGVDVPPERRAGRHARRRRGAEPPAAAATAAMQLRPRRMRDNRRDVDMVVAPPAPLRLTGDLHAAGAALGAQGDRLVRVGASRRETPGREGLGCFARSLSSPPRAPPPPVS